MEKTPRINFNIESLKSNSRALVYGVGFKEDYQSSQIDKFLNVVGNAELDEGVSSKICFADNYGLIFSSLTMSFDECGVGNKISIKIGNYKIHPDFKGSDFEFVCLHFVLSYARLNNIPIIFWIHSISPEKLNKYYEEYLNRPKYYTNSKEYQQFQLNKNFLYLDQKSGKRYFIHYYNLDPDFKWKPLSNCFVKCREDAHVK